MHCVIHERRIFDETDSVVRRRTGGTDNPISPPNVSGR